MLERNRISLGKWVSEITEEEEKKRRAKVDQKLEERRLFKEDIKFLKESGVVDVFKDGARILSSRWPDVKLVRNFNGGVNARLELLWDYSSRISSEVGFWPVTWSCSRIMCEVKRDKDGKQHLWMTGADEIEPNKIRISEAIVEAIKHPQWLSYIEQPNLIKHFTALFTSR